MTTVVAASYMCAYAVLRIPTLEAGKISPMAEIKDLRGKLLLGEAVRLLVQSGATGVAITDFINQYSEVVQATLAPEPATVQPDLKAQVKDALREALEELAPPASRADTGLRKRVSVFIDGARTSVSLRKELVASTVAALGDEKKVRQLIQEYACSKPEGVANRTAWVEQQLEHHLLMVKAEPTLSQQAPH